MRKINMILAALTVTMAICSSVSAFGPYAPSNYSDNTTLTIQQAFLGGGEYEWTYTLFHGSAASDPTPVRQFSVGLLVDDTTGQGQGSLTTGHYYDYSSSFSSVWTYEELVPFVVESR